MTDDDLDTLLALSQVDAEIARIETTMADLPETRAIAEAQERRVAIEREGDALRVDLDQVGNEQRRHERDVEQMRQRLGADQQRLYGGDVTNAREMKSVEAEIASTQQRIDEQEELLLAAMERVEELESEVEERARGTEQVDAELVELEAARDGAASSLLAEQAELQVRRDELRGELSAEPTAAYDRVRERVRSGSAVGELSGASCTSCRIELPRAEINELRDGPPLTTCPNCRRLLVVR